MCVAIYKPAGREIPEKVLRACFDSNKDGCGFAVRFKDGETTKLEVFKGYFAFEDFWEDWGRWGKPYQAILHFRIATHGAVCPENCHPFRMESGTNVLVGAHNGILGGFTRLSTAEKSDTRAFMELAAEPLFKRFPNLLGDPRMLGLLEHGIGAGNKVVMMDLEGRVAILNRHLGVTRTFDESESPPVWFSNDNWEWRTRTHQAGSLRHLDYDDWWAQHGGDGEGGNVEPTPREQFQFICRRASCGASQSPPHSGYCAEHHVRLCVAGGCYQERLTTSSWCQRHHHTEEEATEPGLEALDESDAGDLTLLADVLKVRSLTPRHAERRKDPRRGADDREFWEDGYLDAMAGRPLTKASVTEAYLEGFFNAIEEIEDQPKFLKGLRDWRRNGSNRRNDYKQIRDRMYYSAGWEWGQYESLNKATNVRDNPDNGNRNVAGARDSAGPDDAAGGAGVGAGDAGARAGEPGRVEFPPAKPGAYLKN